MSECCLIADTVQFFKDRGIPFNAQNLINDVSALYMSPIWLIGNSKLFLLFLFGFVLLSCLLINRY